MIWFLPALLFCAMAQAVLLDRLLPGWKERIFKDSVWLEDLLREAANRES